MSAIALCHTSYAFAILRNSSAAVGDGFLSGCRASDTFLKAFCIWRAVAFGSTLDAGERGDCAV